MRTVIGGNQFLYLPDSLHLLANWWQRCHLLSCSVWRSNWTSVSVYESYLEPRMMRKSLFWMRLSWLSDQQWCFYARQGQHTHKSDGYRLRRVSTCNPRLAFETILLTWLCQPRSDWTVRPRVLVLETTSSSLPAIWKLGRQGTSFLKQTCVTLHFLGLSVRWFNIICPSIKVMNVLSNPAGLFGWTDFCKA